MKTIRMPAEQDMDRLIRICRVGAQRDNVRVIIEREIRSDKDPSRIIRRIPLVEITPSGRVSNFAPRMWSLADAFERDTPHIPKRLDRWQRHQAHLHRIKRAAQRAKQAGKVVASVIVGLMVLGATL